MDHKTVWTEILPIVVREIKAGTRITTAELDDYLPNPVVSHGVLYSTIEDVIAWDSGDIIPDDIGTVESDCLLLEVQRGISPFLDDWMGDLGITHDLTQSAADNIVRHWMRRWRGGWFNPALLTVWKCSNFHTYDGDVNTTVRYQGILNRSIDLESVLEKD